MRDSNSIIYDQGFHMPKKNWEEVYLLIKKFGKSAQRFVGPRRIEEYFL